MDGSEGGQSSLRVWTVNAFRMGVKFGASVGPNGLSLQHSDQPCLTAVAVGLCGFGMTRAIISVPIDMLGYSR